MAKENGIICDGEFKKRAKELLKSHEYERLDVVVKTFSKTRSLEGLCSNLVKIVNSPSKVNILAEVRRCLPKNQKNKFTRYCNELLKSESLRARRDLKKKRKVESKAERIREVENRVPFPCSPAKRTKKESENLLNSQREKKASKESKKSVADCEKEVASSNTRDRKFGVGRKSSPLDLCVNKVVILERDSLNESFGFRIRGGNFREPSIMVAEVAKCSLADRQGLKKGDRVVHVNEKRCGKGGVNIAQLIQLIKGAKMIQMRIASSDSICKCGHKVEDIAKVKDRVRNKPDKKRMSTVNICPWEDGWLGCCIRGGADYACEVHVISVDAGSPAERAGLKAGDVIVTINGTSTENLTHVQVVRLVVTSGPCVRTCLKPGGKQMRRSSKCQTGAVRPTPLRTHNGRSHEGTPPRSSLVKQPHLPGYPHSQRKEVADSPSQLPLMSLTLDCLPPPPYTPEVPSRHRVLAKGDEGPGTPCGKPQDTTYVVDPQATQRSQTTQETLGSQVPCNCEQPLSTHFHKGPSHCSLAQQDMGLQDEVQSGLYKQQSQHNHSQEVVMEIADVGDALIPFSDGKGTLEGEVARQFDDGETLEQDSVPCSSIMQQEKTVSLEEDTWIDSSSTSSGTQSLAQDDGTESFLSQIRHFNKSNLKKLEEPLQTSACEEANSMASGRSHTPEAVQTSVVHDCRLSSVMNHSPSPCNGRESFLSQIRQFNKTKLRKRSQSPESSVSDGHNQAPSQSGKTPCTPEEVCVRSGDDRDGEPESIDTESLFATLAQVMKSRAKVMHDTLSSADEFDSDSSFDDSDDEWEL